MRLPNLIHMVCTRALCWKHCRRGPTSYTRGIPYRDARYNGCIKRHNHFPLQSSFSRDSLGGHTLALKSSESKGTLKQNDLDDPDSFARVKPVLMEAIQDALDELETVYDNVSEAQRITYLRSESQFKFLPTSTEVFVK